MSVNMFSVWPLTDGRSYYEAWAASVTAQTVGLSIYGGGMRKPNFTYGHNGNLAETTMAETETVAEIRSASTASMQYTFVL